MLEYALQCACFFVAQLSVAGKNVDKKSFSHFHETKNGNNMVVCHDINFQRLILIAFLHVKFAPTI